MMEEFYDVRRKMKEFAMRTGIPSNLDQSYSPILLFFYPPILLSSYTLILLKTLNFLYTLNP